MLPSECFFSFGGFSSRFNAEYETFSVFCCFGSSPPQILYQIITLVPPTWRCLCLTRQSVGRGPVQPAAQCSLQQSLGEGPLHLLEHCWAQFSFVTGNEDRAKSEEWPPSVFWGRIKDVNHNFFVLVHVCFSLPLLVWSENVIWI